MDVIQIQVKKDKPPYLLGLLCLIPLIGALVGFGLLLYGIVRYKDKWLILIGVGGILWTALVYGALFFFLFNKNSLPGSGFEMLTQRELDEAVMAVEFYKLQHGEYPNRLDELDQKNTLVNFYDPMAKSMDGSVEFKYKRFGDKYTIFSVGRDGIPHTDDDIYPNVDIPDSAKVGLIKR